MIGIMPQVFPREATQGPWVSEHAFTITLWLCLSICIIAFLLRISIRIICFRRLLIEDALMLFALAGLISISVITQLFLSDLYQLYRVEKQFEAPGPDFLHTMTSALHADGIVIVLSIITIWTVKLNFLAFFYRLTRQIRSYRILWWIALSIVLACGVVAISIIPYGCMFRDPVYIISNCATNEGIASEFVVTKVGVAVDVLSDIILTSFPISILWRSQINLRSKAILTTYFSLEGLTIAVTIIRGSIFGAQFYSGVSQVDVPIMDFIWMMFWQYIEVIVSFIINCIISFRSLWASRGQNVRNQRHGLHQQRRQPGSQIPETIGSGGKLRSHGGKKEWDTFYDTVLDTFGDLEGTVVDQDTPEYVQLSGITRTIDLTQRISKVGPGLMIEAGSRVSQSALAASCYYESSIKRHENPESSDRAVVEKANSLQLMKPEAARCVAPGTAF